MLGLLRSWWLHAACWGCEALSLQLNPSRHGRDKQVRCSSHLWSQLPQEGHDHNGCLPVPLQARLLLQPVGAGCATSLTGCQLTCIVQTLKDSKAAGYGLGAWQVLLYAVGSIEDWSLCHSSRCGF